VLGDIHDEGCHAYPKLQYMIVDVSMNIRPFGVDQLFPILVWVRKKQRHLSFPTPQLLSIVLIYHLPVRFKGVFLNGV
jgi:hypothetical protein